MKFIFAFFVFAAMSTAHAQDVAGMNERMEAAIAYENLISVESSVQDMMRELEKIPPFSEDPALLEKIKNTINIAELRDITIQLLVKHFTTEEIQSMTDYYSSPIGQSVFQKLPAYQADLMPLMQRYIEEGIAIGFQHEMEKQQGAGPAN